MRADMVKNLLEANGIVVATPGLEHRAMFGPIYGAHVDIVIRVPRRRLRTAQRLLSAFDAEKPVFDDTRRWRVAGFAALVFPCGGGHTYAGAYTSAAVIFGSQLLALWGVFGAKMPFASVLCMVVTACDLFGSREACERANAQLPVRSGWLSRGALTAFVIVAVGLGALLFLAAGAVSNGRSTRHS